MKAAETGESLWLKENYHNNRLVFAFRQVLFGVELFFSLDCAPRVPPHLLEGNLD